MNLTTLPNRIPAPDPSNTDSILDLFNTPEYKARQQKVRRRSSMLRIRNRLLIDGTLVALGFLLGAILI